MSNFSGDAWSYQALRVFCNVYLYAIIAQISCFVLNSTLCVSLFFRCFDRFFRMVNINERRLVAWRRGFVTENVDLVGLEYLWKSVLVSPEAIVHKPIELLKDVYTNLSTKLQSNHVSTAVLHYLG